MDFTLTLSATEADAAPLAGAAVACPEEAALVRAAVGGEPQAFDQLIALHGRRVFNFLHQFTRNRHDAEDLAQQTFIKAYQNLQRFDCARPMINWLLTIARRTALNHFRASKRWEEMPENLASGGHSPADHAERHDQKDNLWARARQLLSQREFEVLWLRFAEDMSTEETSRVTGLTVAHVKVIVFRAKQTLQKGQPA